MRTPRHPHFVTALAVILLAGIAAVVSYSHMFELALRHGEPAWRAALFPLSVDGMIVASSMTLLADARRGRRGGVLPWALLIIGSGASLAANIAVADPTLWSRIIHAWPSFALIGAYELLMREFRANAVGVRSAHATRAQSGADAASAGEEGPAAGEEKASPPRGYGPVHVLSGPEPVDGSGTAGPGEGQTPPRMQCEAWAWALAHRREDGSLPSGQEIAARFGRKARWGRLVKQRGEQGRFAHAAA